MSSVVDSWASSEHARRTMRANRRRDTGPEMRIRRALHQKGLRYFVDRAPIRGLRRRADLVFSKARIAVFIDGCFWHGCPLHFVEPKTNVDYWKAKIDRNVIRDRETDSRLNAEGWLVIRIWEHERTAAAVDRIIAAWSRRRRQLD
ncbi:DNA mismatch endonuclease vsr [Mycobacteroides abscessus subsp. abscessus]|uniref:very short patch repair endonuclease n=3 Tax=Brevibacterium casei TaxID=33889 RepID=UPI00092B0A46|nr:DNA mismatch endonuclease vsr [Mycobacteroides abscessus subsp. abscessus]